MIPIYTYLYTYWESISVESASTLRQSNIYSSCLENSYGFTFFANKQEHFSDSTLEVQPTKVAGL